jgi:UDP-N-acetylmuramoylalanine-D-glutamate ligase
VGKIIGMPETQILESFQSFQGAAKRLEKIYDDKEKQLTISEILPMRRAK